MFTSLKQTLIASLACFLFMSCSDENCMYENPNGPLLPDEDIVSVAPGGNFEDEIEIDATTKALLTAIQKDDKDALVSLLAKNESKALINEPIASENNQTLLMIAAAWGRQDLVLTLIKAGADKEIESPDGFKAAYYAKKAGYNLIARYLEATLDIDEINNQLYIAAAEKVEDIEFYAMLGADLNFVTPGAGSVLMRAITSQRLENVQKLIELGSDPSLTVLVRGRELNALDYAKATRANPDIIAYLEKQM